MGEKGFTKPEKDSIAFLEKTKILEGKYGALIGRVRAMEARFSQLEERMIKLERGEFPG